MALARLSVDSGKIVQLELETHPVLTIADLKRNGVLGGAVGEHIPISVGHLDVVAKIVAKTDKSTQLILLYPFGEDRHEQQIFVSLIAQGSAMVPHLICPETQISVRRLHFLLGAFASRPYWHARNMLSGNEGSAADREFRKLVEAISRLEGANGFPKARGANRERLMDLVRNSNRVPIHLRAKARELQQSFFDEEQRCKRSAFRSNRGSGPCSTAAALQAGLENPDKERLGMQSRFPPEHWRVPTLRMTPPFVRSEPDILENYPALDLRALNLSARMGGKKVWSHSLRWEGTPVAIPPITLIADFRQPLTPFIVLDVGQQGSPSYHRLLIELVATKPGSKGARWYMQCPITRSRCEFLLWRNGRFASAKAHRLVPSSQRG